MKRIVLLTVISVLAGGLVFAEEGYHTFTDVFGQQTEARIVKVERGQVHLEERDGGKLSLSMKSLPEPEQKVVGDWIRQGRTMKEAAPPSGKSRAESSGAKMKIGDDTGEPKAMAPGEEDLISRYRSLMNAGRFAEAKPLAEKWMRLSESFHGRDHPSTALSLNEWALFCFREGRFDEAETLCRRSLAIREKALGADHPDTVMSRNNLAELYRATGRFKQAEALLKPMMTDRADASPDANSLNNLATVYRSTGRDEEAEALYRRALALREEEQGPDHPETALCLNNLAEVCQAMGRSAEAERFYRRALAIYRKAFGPAHPYTAATMNNLGTLYQQRGGVRQAEEFLEQALAIQDEVLGSAHPDTVKTLINLGELHRSLGRFNEAEAMVRRALAGLEKRLGAGHPDTAAALNNLANIYQDMGRYDEAESLCVRALGISEKSLGPDHATTATSLGNLAFVYHEMGRSSEAEPLYRRALEIEEKRLGLDHPVTAVSLNNLALLYKDTGRTAAAEPLYRRSLRIFEQSLGPEHPNTTISLSNLAVLRIDGNDQTEALELARRENAGRIGFLRRVLSFSTESERLTFRQTLRPFSLIASLGAAEETADAVLRCKGIVLESLLEDWRAAGAADDPAVAEILEQRRTIQSVLRRAILEGGKVGGSRDGIAALEKQLRELEKELAGRGAGTGGARRSLALTARTVSQALPRDLAILEYFRYEHYLSKGRWQARYGAVILRNGQAPLLRSCGAAEKIDATVVGLRRALANVDDVELERSARSLYETLLEPLESGLTGVERLAISPDAQLNFAPFAALLDGNGRFAGERFSIGYLAGGRDVVTQRQPFSGSPPVLVGGPTFRGDGEIALADRGVDASLQREVRTDDIKKLEFVPLPAAEREAGQVEALLGNATVLTRGDATESAIRSVKSPRVLHLATHGFFFKEIDLGGGNADSQRPMEIGAGGWENRLVPKGLIVNPMYRSGIALAGAQTTIESWRRGEVPDPDNDGILMAAEVADLDLRGTDLVTLSACSTATGEVLDGEGVLGLRRGFVMAGARNLLMTLWPVADEDTADFMEDFYTRYAETGNASKSLAEVQREWLVRLRKEKGLVHAVNRAAPFIMSSQGRLD